jgi:hypothetical protein
MTCVNLGRSTSPAAAKRGPLAPDSEGLCSGGLKGEGGEKDDHRHPGRCRAGRGRDDRVGRMDAPALRHHAERASNRTLRRAARRPAPSSAGPHPCRDASSAPRSTTRPSGTLRRMPAVESASVANATVSSAGAKPTLLRQLSTNGGDALSDETSEQ